MPFSSQLGTASSRLGNEILGAGSSRTRPILFQRTGISFGSSASTRSIAFPSDVAEGNLLVVCVSTYNDNAITLTVSDDLGNNYALVDTYSVTGLEKVSMWWCLSTTSGSCTVSVTPSAAALMSIGILEYGGLPLNFGLDFGVPYTDDLFTLTTADIRVRGPGSLIIACFGQGSQTASLSPLGGFASEIDLPFGAIIEALYVIDKKAVDSNLSATGSLPLMRPYTSVGASFGVPWFPFTVEPGEEIPELFQEQVFLPSPAIFTPPPNTDWQPFGIVLVPAIPDEKVEAPRPITPVNVLTGGRRSKVPLLVPRDPRQDKKTQRHEQIVAMMMNSLLLRGRLISTAQTVYDLGYTPASMSPWNGSEPETVWEALDRIAAALATLGQLP